MTTMSESTMQKWLKTFKSGVLTKVNCKYVCSHLNELMDDTAFKDAFFEHMPEEGYDLAADHKQDQIMSLRLNHLKGHELSVVSSDFDLKLIGLCDRSSKDGVPQFSPVYRSIAKNGTFFEYADRFKCIRTNTSGRIFLTGQAKTMGNALPGFLDLENMNMKQPIRKPIKVRDDG